MPLFFIIVIGFIIRLVGINQSLWLDEAISANVATHLSYFQVISHFSPSDFHPPLFYLILKFWVSLFGASPLSLRLPSVLSSIVTGLVVYQIGKLLKDKKTGYLAAVLFLCNPLVVYYSQEARMYSLVTLFLTLSLYFFIKIIKSSDVKSILLFNVFTALSFFTFYGSVFLIISFYFYFVIAAGYKNLFKILPGFLLALSVLSPLLYLQYAHSKNLLSLVPDWHLVLGSLNIKNLLLIPVKFSIGRISFYPKWLYFLLSTLAAFFVFIIGLKGLIKNRLLLFLFLMPLLFGALFSLFSPMFQYFRFIYLIPILVLGAALVSHAKFWQIILVLTFLGFTSVYLLDPQFHREDWQSLSVSIPRSGQVYMIDSFSDPIRYYRPDVTVIDIRRLKGNHSESLLVIPYGEAIHAVGHKELLTSQNYQLVKIANFRQITLETWK